MVLDRPLGAPERTPDSEKRGDAGMLQRAGAVAGDVKAFAVRQAHDVRDAAERKTEAVMTFVRARPVESVLIGAAVGYVLGWWASKAIVERRNSARRRRRLYEL